MCGLLLWLGARTQLRDCQLSPSLIYRGPDDINKHEDDKFYLAHTRLSISHSSISQPRSYPDGVTIAFNGEIYGHQPVTFGNTPEIDYIHELYSEYSINYAKHLNGEFSIIIIDNKRGIVLISRDYFGTKPLFFWAGANSLICSSISDQVVELAIACQTLPTAHGSIQSSSFPANCTTVIDIETLRVVQSVNLYQPRRRNYLGTKQRSDIYEEWKRSVYSSFINRWPATQKVFLPLSSGHDSGLLASLSYQLDYRPTLYCIPRGENLSVLHKRLQILLSAGFEIVLIDMEENDHESISNFINVETDHVAVPDSALRCVDVVRDDPASIGAATIYKHAHNNNFRVMLSGQGGDEIYSGYGAFGSRDNTSRYQIQYSPDTQLGDLFPWVHLEGGRMSQFLLKEEVIATRFSIEARYPFLSTESLDVFLQFRLQDIANNYKGPIEVLLEEHEFPFDNSRIKRGFNPYSKDRSQEFMDLYKYITVPSSDIWSS